MEPTEYRGALRAVLDTASAAAAARLAAIRNAATARTDGVIIDVFVDQDGHGTFDVWARFEGPDAFTLDRQLGDERALFGVIWGTDGWDPDVPVRPRAWTRMELTDAIIDVVAEWVDPLIAVGTDTLYWEVGTPDGDVDPRTVGANRE
ncbi:DUF6389 family protein [Rhodococcus sp. NPDC056743]|uniref:DUF6389 family protein n=1 Tax=Rhodococcus sp. NPDC056743 TaxID=3345934 RepID=UPI00366A972E